MCVVYHDANVIYGVQHMANDLIVSYRNSGVRSTSAYIPGHHSLSNNHAPDPDFRKNNTFLRKSQHYQYQPTPKPDILMHFHSAQSFQQSSPPSPPPTKKSPFSSFPFSHLSFIQHLPLPLWRSTMPRRYTRRWRSTTSRHYGSSAWMLGLYVGSITRTDSESALISP